MTKQEIIHLALENLQKQTHISGRWIPAAQKDFDGEVALELDGRNLKYHAEIKNELRNHHLQQIHALNEELNPLMVVAVRLFPKIKKELRNQNIAYLEANGNIFLKNNKNLIWIDANEPYREETKTGSRAFTKTGLKVLFQFLLDETWINRPYRQIAEQTGTGIGNITNIITGLKQDGFLLPIAKKEYRLNNKKSLLDKWVTAYDLRLKPTLKIGTFRFLKEQDFNNWRNVPLLSDKTLWGGEPAGDLLTNYLRPAELTMYTNETRNELIKNYRLIPDDKGNVKAYQKFWKQEELENKTYAPYEIAVPPLLVYTDLINTGDRRCIETAQKIYDEFLQDKL
jgi:hypothetical protein